MSHSFKIHTMLGMKRVAGVMRQPAVLKFMRAMSTVSASLVQCRTQPREVWIEGGLT